MRTSPAQSGLNSLHEQTAWAFMSWWSLRSKCLPYLAANTSEVTRHRISLLFTLILRWCLSIVPAKTLLDLSRSSQTPETCMIALREPMANLLTRPLKRTAKVWATLPYALHFQLKLSCWEPVVLHQRRDWMWANSGYLGDLKSNMWACYLS